jgi:glyoxylase-like metal-dependent hydrolase (beta-lactamase superfamily II)
VAHSKSWDEIGDRVFVRRYEFFDQNIGVVLGGNAALVIDTRTTYRQAREVLDDLSELTSARVEVVVDTHGHYDHAYGNRSFRPATIWAHVGCRPFMERTGDARRERIISELPELAEDIREVEIDPPDRSFEERAVVEVDGRQVELRFLGRGHTDHDLVVEVEADGDATVIFAGDLVEQGAPPAFDDAWPAEWPATLGRLHALARGPVVPGHGAVVDAAFVGTQRAELLAVLDALREDRLDAGPYPPATMRTAATRLRPPELRSR